MSHAEFAENAETYRKPFSRRFALPIVLRAFSLNSLPIKLQPLPQFLHELVHRSIRISLNRLLALLGCVQGLRSFYSFLFVTRFHDDVDETIYTDVRLGMVRMVVEDLLALPIVPLAVPLSFLALP